MNMHHGAGWRVAGGPAIESVLERPLLDKLGAEVDRYQDKDFLKAVMAVCALTACADDEILRFEFFHCQSPSVANLTRLRPAPLAKERHQAASACKMCFSLFP